MTEIWKKVATLNRKITQYKLSCQMFALLLMTLSLLTAFLFCLEYLTDTTRTIGFWGPYSIHLDAYDILGSHIFVAPIIIYILTFIVARRLFKSQNQINLILTGLISVPFIITFATSGMAYIRVFSYFLFYR